MIDPATGWFKIATILNKQADQVMNVLEFQWLTRHPWPTKVVLDRGRKFAAEVSAAVKNKYGLNKKSITACNPQANATWKECIRRYTT